MGWFSSKKKYKKCNNCEGTGKMINQSRSGEKFIKCNECNGKGEIEVKEDKCTRCNGTGWIKKRGGTYGQMIPERCDECDGTGKGEDQSEPYDKDGEHMMGSYIWS